jgi:hypothetical protein
MVGESKERNRKQKKIQAADAAWTQLRTITTQGKEIEKC